MELALFIAGVLGSLLDPIRWGICAAVGWLVPNLFLALLVGVGSIEALSLLLIRSLQDNVTGAVVLTHIVASGLIVSLFHYLRLRKDAKAKRAPDTEL